MIFCPPSTPIFKAINISDIVIINFTSALNICSFWYADIVPTIYALAVTHHSHPFVNIWLFLGLRFIGCCFAFSMRFISTVGFQPHDLHTPAFASPHGHSTLNPRYLHDTVSLHLRIAPFGFVLNLLATFVLYHLH